MDTDRDDMHFLERHYRAFGTSPPLRAIGVHSGSAGDAVASND